MTYFNFNTGQVSQSWDTPTTSWFLPDFAPLFWGLVVAFAAAAGHLGSN